MKDAFRFSDEFGPGKIIQVYEPTVGLKAVLVVDNVAQGPALGGVRMAPDVSTEECFRLARAMTFKNAAAELPHGGGKVVLYGDPDLPRERKEPLIRALAAALRDVREYIFAPDMGTDEECMAWVRDEVDRVVALPRQMGGIPLDEIGATAWGLRHATEIALGRCDFKLDGARVVVQGFGAVGLHVARFLADHGAILVGAADSQGAIYNRGGLRVADLVELKEQKKSVADCPDGERFDRDAVVGFECDIWIPAARPDVLREDNVDRLQARMVVEGANIPCTPEAEKRLYERGVLVVPDFIANAGGVICAAMEYRGATETAALQAIEEKVRRNTALVLDNARRADTTPRQAARELALGRVRKAMATRRWAIY